MTVELRTLFILLLVAGNLPAADRVLIELPERVTVTKSVVTIGDLGPVTGGESPVRTAMGMLDIADRPGRDRPIQVTRKQVEFRLKLAGFAADAFLVVGAESCSVLAESRTITPEQVIASARTALLKRLPWREDEISIEMITPVVARLPDVVAGDDVVLHAEPHSPNIGLGRAQIDVTILVRGERKMSLPVLFESRLYQQVAVVTRPIPAGELLNETNTKLERRPVDPNRRYVLGEETPGRKARKHLQVGTQIAIDDLDNNPKAAEPAYIKNRQKVTLTVNLGAMQVNAIGEAMQEGKLGQMIRVQNVDSKKIVTGKVVSPGTVEVDIGGTP